MKEKIIRKEQLDALIELVRELCDSPYNEGNVDRIIKEAIKVARAIEDDTDVMWNGPYDLVWSILHSGMKRGATNKDIYQVLEVLGWEVKDEA